MRPRPSRTGWQELGFEQPSREEEEEDDDDNDWEVERVKVGSMYRG